MRLAEEGLADPFQLMEMLSPEHVPTDGQSTCEDTSTRTADTDGAEDGADDMELQVEGEAESASDQGMYLSPTIPLEARWSDGKTKGVLQVARTWRHMSGRSRATSLRKARRRTALR